MSELTAERETEQSTDSEVLVSVRGLKTYYGEGGLTGDPVRAVDGVDFDIHRGETLGLVGESGCGKTTLGRTLVRLERATEGVVDFEGQDVTTLSGKDLKHWRRNAQIVFQDPESSLNDRMTVGEIIREPLDVHDWPHLSVRVEGEPDAAVTGDANRADADATGQDVDMVVEIGGAEPRLEIRDALPLQPEEVSVEVTDRDPATVRVRVGPSKGRLRRRHVRVLLDRVGMSEDHFYRYPHQFSGGQRQRIGIARALALEPSFVVLDEPVSALDVSVQAKILNLLEELQEEFGLTYLFIAHDLAVVRHICDRVAVMYLGNIMELGPTEELFSSPANPYTHSLLSAIPRPDPTAEQDPITLRGTPPSPRYPPSGCPLSTRCPAKIRPPELEGLDEGVWESIDDLARVVRERRRADRTLRERIRGQLGMETRFSDVEDIVVELFETPDDLPDDPTTEAELTAILESLPPAIRDPVGDVVEHLRNDREDAALDRINDAFGSECDAEHPDFYDVGTEGRVSACLRHREEFDSVEETLERRYGSHAGEGTGGRRQAGGDERQVTGDGGRVGDGQTDSRESADGGRSAGDER